MLALSRQKVPPAEVDQNAIVKVPKVDRERLVYRNVLAVVVSVNESGLYQLGTKEDFEVVRVTQAMVRDFHSFLTNSATKAIKNKNGHFSVTKYKSFKYSGNQITVSVTHNLECLSETFVAQRRNIPYPFQWTSNRLYSEPIPVNPLKLKNIKELSKYVPLRYQGWWYEFLQSQNEEAAEEEIEDRDGSDVD
ncbi:hypothetical protein ILUMI_10691 [Ignelater luminosus]|uniref:Uncharacterized protein n=1 Tax=Ignelater luminosus TaxID=2038154 RepID=A0A8K0G8F9_IGNLU|nr:hypothetical protein ILUMI_10691 [Ignelater luminosus]